MNELAIDGKVFSVEQDAHNELTVFGGEAIEFISEVVEGGRRVCVSEGGFSAEKVFPKVLAAGVRGGVRFIRIETLTVRLL